MEYEKCDTQMIIGMLHAETKTKKVKSTSWSPTFAKAVSCKAFWKIALSHKLLHRYPSHKLIQWAKDLGVDNFMTLDILTIKSKLREAQHELRKIEIKANELRENHLRELLTDAELNGEETKVK
jgi:hypothetical protein